MSDLPSSPGSPFPPFSPWGPGSPCDPLRPGSPGAPTHTHVHAYTNKYCDEFSICLQCVTTYMPGIVQNTELVKAHYVDERAYNTSLTNTQTCAGNCTTLLVKLSELLIISLR